MYLIIVGFAYRFTSFGRECWWKYIKRWQQWWYEEGENQQYGIVKIWETFNAGQRKFWNTGQNLSQHLKIKLFATETVIYRKARSKELFMKEVLQVNLQAYPPALWRNCLSNFWILWNILRRLFFVLHWSGFCGNTWIYLRLCAIWYNLRSLKNVKNSHGGVLLFIKLEVSSLFFNKLAGERSAILLKKEIPTLQLD